jgi:hypothetical protein
MALRRPPSSTSRHAPTSRIWTVRRSIAVLAALVVAGIALASTPGASADPVPVSQAAGRFLSGSIAGHDLDDLAAIKGESAVNTGGPLVAAGHSLDVSVLNHQLLNLPNGVQLPGGGVLTLGAVNQYAEAGATGSAQGASGAVTNSGAIGFGGASASPQTDATLDLTGSQNPLAALGTVKLGVGAIAATAHQAEGCNGAQTGTYELANLKLWLHSSVLAGAVGKLTGTGSATGLSDLIAQLGGTGLNVAPLLNVKSLSSTASLTGAVKSLGDVDLYNGAITGSLSGGALTIDVAKLLKGVLHLDVNNLAPNTSLIDEIVKALPQALSGGVEQVRQHLTAAFGKLSLSLNGTPLGPVGGQAQTALALLLAPLNSALSSGTTSLSSIAFAPITTQLKALIDVVVNVQEHGSGTFTERALQVKLLAGAGAQLNLASASVGPSSVCPPTGTVTPVTGSTAAIPHNAGTPGLANTGFPLAAKVTLFGLVALCLGAGLLFGVSGVRKKMGRHSV